MKLLPLDFSPFVLSLSKHVPLFFQKEESALRQAQDERLLGLSE